VEDVNKRPNSLTSWLIHFLIRRLLNYAVSAGEVIKRRMTMEDSEGFRSRRPCPIWRYYAVIRLDRLRKLTKNLGHDSRHSNWISSEYNSRRLPICQPVPSDWRRRSDMNEERNAGRLPDITR
jgi:hypothetical protein